MNITRRQAVKLADAQENGELDYPCIHGHFNCSYIGAGPCSNEHREAIDKIIGDWIDAADAQGEDL